MIGMSGSRITSRASVPRTAGSMSTSRFFRRVVHDHAGDFEGSSRPGGHVVRAVLQDAGRHPSPRYRDR